MREGGREGAMSERAHVKGEGEEGGREGTMSACTQRVQVHVRACRGCRWIRGIQGAHARRSKLGRVYRSYSEGRIVYKYSV